jgi:hypothetical protein
MMCPAIDDVASFEIRAVVLFIHVRNTSAAEIHRELCAIYLQYIMSEGTVRQWCGMVKDGRTNVHDGGRSGRPAVCSE